MWNRVPGRWIILFLFLINLYTKINNKLILDGVKVRKGKIKRMSFEKILAVWSSEFGRSHTDSRIKLWTHRESQNFQHSLCLVSQGITARLKCYSETKQRKGRMLERWPPGSTWFISYPNSFPSQTISIFLGARDRLFVTWNLEAIDIFSKQALERIMFRICRLPDPREPKNDMKNKEILFFSSLGSLGLFFLVDLSYRPTVGQGEILWSSQLRERRKDKER